MKDCLLAIDQGTTSTRAIVFDVDGRTRAAARRNLISEFPADGWVDQDAHAIWRDTMAVCAKALERSGNPRVAAVGIANQRETTVVWDRETGIPVCNAIVWQDRRTAKLCNDLREQGLELEVRDRTGLVIDPYFSATKLMWILERVPGVRSRAERGELAFGTVDSYLLWQLTDGRVHKTDAANASRTMLFNLKEQDWDRDLLAALRIPASLLPEVCDNASRYGVIGGTGPLAGMLVGGMAGDQQAALIGQGCCSAGSAKSTYGTGCFLVVNTGPEIVRSRNRLLSTVGYRLRGKPTYALEGSIFTAGAAINWLRDQLGLIDSVEQSAELARRAGKSGNVFLVPAFTGLGAPHWDAGARAAVLGLRYDSGVPEIVRAALQSVAFQTLDLLEAMEADGTPAPKALRVDGGMSANDWLLQCLADILDVPVHRPEVVETTAWGAAFLAGLTAGAFDSIRESERLWRADREVVPTMEEEDRARLCVGWKDAVARVKSP